MTPPPKSLVESLILFHADRQRAGLRRKYARMAQGAFEFFRGTDQLYVRAWSALRPRDPGPAIVVCGDLHLENFGAFPTDDGEFRFDVNDFDEAAVAPCSFDLVRCATSILLAAESWRLTPTQGTGMVLEYLDSYRESVETECGSRQSDEADLALGTVAGLLDATRRGSRKALLRRYAKRRGDAWRFRYQARGLSRIRRKTRHTIAESIEQFGRDNEWRVLDVARRFSGVGSLGLRRYPVLIHKGDADEPRLMDLKEAVPSVLASLAQASPTAYANEAERVVAAQRLLQGKPTAGLSAVEIAGRAFRLRDMIPEENRSSLDRLQKSPRRLREAVAVAGRLTARLHRRGSHINGNDLSAALRAWAASPALEAVLAAAVRFADLVQRDFATYLDAYRDGAFVA
jgi:uncharacterized protein (DUF2252 family)